MNGNQPAATLIGQYGCFNCKYFKETGSKDGMGECRRYPPKTEHMLVGLETPEGKPPVPQFHRVVSVNLTPFDGWCGEHQRALLKPDGKKAGAP